MAAGFTLVDRTKWCQLYAGKENDSSVAGFLVTFEPFVEGEDVVREFRDLKITFSAFTICIRSTTWQLESEKDPESGRRLIGTGSNGEISNYFRISRDGEGMIYSTQWCPTDVYPLCRLACGSVGVLVKDGKRFMAFNGSVLPILFERV